jgi:two-component system chemotaxis response regulator CheY
MSVSIGCRRHIGLVEAIKLSNAPHAPAAIDALILIVDDNRDAALFIRKLLVHIGFHQIRLAPREMALEVLRDRPACVVISDLSQSPGEGARLLQSVRADDQLKHIPFVMIAESAEPERLIEAKKLGVSGYILKPFNINTLKRTMEHVLARQ